VRVAIVHDWLTVRGGAEVVLEAMLEAYPDADVHTLVYQRSAFRTSPIGRRKIKVSVADRLPGVGRHHRLFIPFYPFAVEQLDVSGVDVVISNTFAVSQGVITGPDQIHIAYANRTMQYLWESYHDELRDFGFSRGPLSLVARGGLHYVRAWDQLAWRRPDVVIANSDYTARRLAKHYGRSASVIYPPVAVDEALVSGERGDYFVTASRLVPVKRIDVIVEAFRLIQRPLWIVGDGPERARLEAMAAPGVRFLGWQDARTTQRLIAGSRGYVTAATEAFGIAAAEAQQLGVMVIGPARGGASEIVVDGETGTLFDAVTPDALADAVLRAERLLLNAPAEQFMANGQRFHRDEFKARLTATVAALMRPGGA
jgi:glycosyltransferase involved in cell wall biosynthesis